MDINTSKLYIALRYSDQDLIPVLSKLERAVLAGEQLAKEVEERHYCELLERGKGPCRMCDSLYNYRTALEDSPSNL